MQAAAARAAAAKTQGSSTCCIVLLDTRHGRLASANIGDSGFLILGVTPNNPKPHVKLRTPQQEHQFGCPYQLGHHAAADPPEDAMLTTLPVSCCFFFRPHAVAVHVHLSLYDLFVMVKSTMADSGIRQVVHCTDVLANSGVRQRMCSFCRATINADAGQGRTGQELASRLLACC